MTSEIFPLLNRDYSHQRLESKRDETLLSDDENNLVSITPSYDALPYNNEIDEDLSVDTSNDSNSEDMNKTIRFRKEVSLIENLSDQNSRLDDLKIRDKTPLMLSAHINTGLRNIGNSFASGFVSFTESKFALRLCFVSIISFLTISILAFYFIFPEEWTVIDCIYFAVVTFTTTGYGDLYPVGSVEKVFTSFFILSSVMVIGLALGIIGEHLTASHKETHKSRRKDLEDSFIQKISERNVEQSMIKFRRSSVCDDLLDIFKRTGVHLLFTLSFGLTCGYYEGWDLVTSIYYCIVTMTSVGYGDVSPQTQPMRLLAVFFIPFSVAVTAEFLSSLAGIYIKRKSLDAEVEFMNRRMTEEDFKDMDIDGDGTIYYGEFLTFMLTAMGKVEKEELKNLRKVYLKLDKNKDGSLSKEDLLVHANF